MRCLCVSFYFLLPLTNWGCRSLVEAGNEPHGLTWIIMIFYSSEYSILDLVSCLRPLSSVDKEDIC